MTKDEIQELLNKHEWRDVEFKASQRGVSESAYETVSAFANTAGGWLVFGVRKHDNVFEIVGVIEVDKVQNDFLSVMRGGGKLSRVIDVKEELVEHDDKTLLVFYIPESPRLDKPIHLNRDIMRSFIRRGGGDEQCNEAEIKRFIRDASPTPYDGEPIEDISAEGFYDEEVVTWYRGVFNRREPGRHEALSDLEFLREWAFVVERQGNLLPNRAGILFFGKARYVRQILSRPVVDFQRIDFPSDEWTPEMRWNDRVTVEDNLVRAWWAVVERYMKLAERPFSIDATTMRRDDEPPDYISFRESVINLLMHQDYGDHGRLARIQIFRDRTAFWNPGDAFYSKDQLLDAGAKAVRNQNIVNAFRRIGLSDQAGSGIRAIFKSWHTLGHVPPDMVNDRTEKTFELVLKREPLFTEKQRILQATLGVHLSDPEAEAFAYACKVQRLTVTDVRSITARSPAEAKAILDRLVLQVLLKAVDVDAGVYELQDQFKLAAGNLPTGQVDGETANLLPEQVAEKSANLLPGQVKPIAELSDRQWAIMAMCDVPRSVKEMMTSMGLKSRNNLVYRHLNPLLDAHLVARTIPEKPQAKTQKYVLTRAGLDLLVWKQTKNGRK